ncbi:MAG: sulfotransferase family protein [Allosphingosinicella sp.]
MRPALPAFDRLRGRGRALPDFIVVGAMKAGTTSLYAWLGEHPQVVGTEQKEVHYFDHNHARGPDWYRRAFPKLAAIAERRERLGKRVVTGESSPYYLFHPLAAERIASLLPDVRIIALLRDPVERAYSHYRQTVRQGNEPLPFEQALAAEDERLEGAEQALASGRAARVEAHRQYSYRSRGLYLDQLRRYFDRFPAGNILVLRSEDMFENPQAVFDRAVEFLGLDPLRLQNPEPRNRAPEAAEAIPGEAKLRTWFEPHNRALYDFLGRDMGW